MTDRQSKVNSRMSATKKAFWKGGMLIVEITGPMSNRMNVEKIQFLEFLKENMPESESNQFFLGVEKKKENPKFHGKTENAVH